MKRSDFAICKTKEGKDWVLGEGSFGTVRLLRCRPACLPTCLPTAHTSRTASPLTANTSQPASPLLKPADCHTS